MRTGEGMPGRRPQGREGLWSDGGAAKTQSVTCLTVSPTKQSFYSRGKHTQYNEADCMTRLV